ncbi:cysteine dioxygenase [Paenibacillus whitsoniae]|uniref:Cysteine dioxygenase n=1 Tax=Paenibacillus whitsoniae TaxID=2496558 RepID=A0A3S0I930_9BACL|nr:cysteine dioxygenase [Paenibacillus whitsoniae]RTE07856.1 cysteine dioxygenase [Paenibacillus whitsoniae]
MSAQFKELEAAIAAVLAASDDYRTIIEGVRPHLRKLLAEEGLLPAELAEPHPDKYAQYLLYKPENEAFSVVAFVWGAGQVAPVHDHLIWGLVGVYRGAVVEKRYRRVDLGEAAEPRYEIREVGEVTARQGDISFVYPPDHDIHGVANPFGEPAITVHIYGTDIGKQPRHIHDVASGSARDVVTKHLNEVAIYG